jgi:hypothetical protein
MFHPELLQVLYQHGLKQSKCISYSVNLFSVNLPNFFAPKFLKLGDGNGKMGTLQWGWRAGAEPFSTKGKLN